MPDPSMPELIEFKPFVSVGPQGLDGSKRFYEALGFEVMWEQGNAYGIDTGQGKLVLARHEGEGADDSTKHQMLHLWVEDVDAWHAYLGDKRLEERFDGVRVAEPERMPWGLRVCFVWDPSGVLIHVRRWEMTSGKARVRPSSSRRAVARRTPLRG